MVEMLFFEMVVSPTPINLCGKQAEAVSGFPYLEG